MLNPTNLSDIVTKTLKRMDVSEPAVANLIRGTFAVETGLEYFADIGHFGLALMRPREVEEMYKEIFKYNKKLSARIFTATDIDINRISYEDFKFHLISNVAFMVAVLYTWYSIKYDEIPENNVNALAKHYVKYYVGEQSVDLEKEFKETYLQTFVNK